MCNRTEYTATECSCDADCGHVGICQVVRGEFDEMAVLCPECVLQDEYPEDFDSQFDDDFEAMAQEFDEFYGDLNDMWDDHIDADEPPMYGYDSDNPISMGAYDE